MTFLSISLIAILQIHLISCAHYQQHTGFPVGLPAPGQQQTANQDPQQQSGSPLDSLPQQQPPPASSQPDRVAPLQLDGQLDPRPAAGHSSRSSEREGPIFRYQGVALNGTSIKLVWNLLNGYHADFFDIKWGPIPDGTHQFSLNKLNGTVRDHIFHQLQPDTLYQFELHGYHGNHVYKPQLVAVRTHPANYATKNPRDFNIMPLGVKAESKSNTSIQVSWSEPDRPSNLMKSIRMNVIRYHVNTASPASNETAASSTLGTTVSPQYHYLNITDSRESRVLISKLQPATEYGFAVKTVYYSPDMKRIFRESFYSMDTFAKTLDIEPSAPRNFTIVPLALSEADLRTGQRGRLDLSWLPPESPNGQLKGYTILWLVFDQPLNPQDIQTDGAQQWNKIDLGSAISSHQVGNLRPGATYYFKLRAINQRGPGAETETRFYTMPALPPSGPMINMPVPQSNILLVIVICFIAVVFCLFLLVSRLACKPRRKSRKGSLKTANSGDQKNGGDQSAAKLNGFASTNSGVSSTVAARVGTLARRRDNANNGKPDFWISAMDSGHPKISSDVKSNISEKSNSELNMAMVSLQRESPQFATTQLAPNLPDYRFASIGGHHHQQQEQHLLQQLQQQQQTGHYHPGHFAGAALGFDQMDSATASALMTLSKRQQQQMQKYQIQFASTGGAGSPVVSSAQTNQVGGAQAPSPHQQPPPPPPLNIEQQQQNQHQSLYGTHQTMQANTRSLRLHRPTLYDPVSGSFLQSAEAGPPNYSSHHQQLPSQHLFLNNSFNGANGAPHYNPITGVGGNTAAVSNTLQFHPHQSSTLLSRRSTNTLRSFQTANSQPTGNNLYGQLAGGLTAGTNGNSSFGANHFAVPTVPPNSVSSVTQPQQLLQSHQAVINQLNNSTYPSLPLKHVSAVRPQIMSNLDDQIEMELAEKEHQEQQTNNQHQQHQDQPQTIKQ